MRMYLTLLTILIVSCSAIAQINTDSLIIQQRLALDAAVDNWNEADMRNARATFERILPLTDKPWLAHYYIAYADYNLGLNLISQQKSEDAEKFIDDAVEHLMKAIDLDTKFAEGFALLSTCYGLKINFMPIKSIYLGPRSGVAISKALNLAPDNPRIHLIDGIGKYHSPSMFGGGIDKAKPALEKAVELYNSFQPASALLPDWGHEGPHVWLGRIAMQEKRWDDAQQHFDDALAIKPNHGLVKYVLLPNLNKSRTASTE